MPRDKLANSRETGLEFLLPVREQLELSYLKDIIKHWGNNPSLILIGIDSLALGEAFVGFIRKNSPLPVKRHNPKEKANIFNILQNANQLDAGTVHLLFFYNDMADDPQVVASNLIFYRDYIPQFKLKIVLIASHILLKTIIEKAYDFYSISSFSGFFTDLYHAVQEDLEPVKPIPGPVLEFEKSYEEVNHYRQKENVNLRILMKKLFNSAVLAIEISRYDEALAFLNEAYEITEKIDNREYQAMVLRDIGIIHSLKGEFEVAYQYYMRALKIFREIGNSRQEAQIKNVIKYIKIRGKFGDTSNFYIKKLEKAEMFDESIRKAVVYNQTGFIQSIKGEFDKALKSHENALDIFKEFEDLNGEAFELEYIGIIYWQMGHPKKALGYLKKALRIFRKNGDLQGEATFLMYLGSIFIDSGDLDNALAYLEKGLELSRKINSLLLESSYFIYIGSIYRFKGDFDHALKCFAEGLAIAKKISDLSLELSHQSYIGQMYRLKGEYAEALKCCEKVLKIVQKTGYFEIEVLNLGEIGVIYLNKGEYAEALKYSQEALEKSEKQNFQIGKPSNLMNIGNIHFAKGEYAEALRYFQETLDIAGKVWNAHEEASALMGIGRVYHSQCNFDEAIKYFKKALELAQKAGFKLLTSELNRLLKCSTDMV